jgi:translation initiation factor IF-2
MRIHELAKELDVKAKDIFPHLKKLGIEFKNHMSAISEDDVARVKNLINPPTAENVVEQRIKPTIIRRRRKAEEEPPPEVEEAPQEAVVAEVLPESAQGEEAEKKEKAEETEEGKEKETQKEEASPQEASPQQEKAKTPPPKVPQIKIIGKKVVLPEVDDDKEEDESDKKKGKLKRRRPKKERFFPGEDLTKKKSIPISSKDFKEEETTAPEEPSKVYRPISPRRKKQLSLAKAKKTQITTPKAIKRKIKLVDGITVGQLAKRMSVKAGEVIKKLMQLGVMATVNEIIDIDAASLAAHEFDYEIELTTREEEQILVETKDSPEELLPRAPIVTVMGHIDHGKTSLLDAIRQTNVTEKEAGGITQHIGAYHVQLDKGNIIFIDTPGHEAFTTMRARGAKVTDIVVLVVAADDGVMPQTIEAIDHSKAAQVPLIVAINKIDKPNADPERVKQSLTQYDLVPEDWGGETLYAEISAKQRTGIENLLETVILQAEMLELRANPNKPAKGTVIEAKLDKNRGPVATILIQEGTLKVGDTFISGVHFGKARVLIDDLGEEISQTGPSTPVQVLGLTGVPEAGDNFLVVDEEKKARQAGMYLQQKQREKGLTQTKKVTLEGLHEQIMEGEIQELNVIIKVDVHGTLDALTKSLEELGNENVKINIIHASVGAINQSDVMLASASQAIIIGFGVKPDPNAKQIAEQEKVDVRSYNIIYDAIADVKKALEGLLAPTLLEKPCGKAEVRQVFQLSNLETIAGSVVTEGKIVRGNMARLMRNSTAVHEGKISSLKRFKDNAREVESGYECGISIEGFKEIEIGDTIECYTVEEVPTKL